MAVMVMIVTSAAAMSFSKARKEALFLSDKMAYELSLSLSQYEAVYEINLDYFLGVYDPIDLDGVYWLRRNADLRYVLTAWQWQLYTDIPDFYRPLSWKRRHTFTLVLRSRYTRGYYFYDRPSIYYSFRGGHNTGYDSYYAGREFHRPATPNTQLHYGSSAPSAYGTTRPATKGNPSYHFGDAKPATPAHGTSRSGNNVDQNFGRPSTQGAGTQKTQGGQMNQGGKTPQGSGQMNQGAGQNVNRPATTTSRPQTFGGSQRGNSGTTRSNTSSATTNQRSTTSTPQRSATTTSTPQRSNSSSTTTNTSTSGSTRGGRGSTRGNSGGSRGR